MPDIERGTPTVDAENQRIVHSAHVAERIEDQYLAARSGMNLRAEAVTQWGRAKAWETVVEEFEDYIWRQWKAANTIENERGFRPTSHRFTPSAARDRYGRTLGADRAAYRLWGSDLTTVFVVRRAMAFGQNGQPQPPADHLVDLLKGNRNAYRAYRRHLADRHGLTYARLTVLEPHRNGYGHVNDILFVEDPEDVVGEMDVLPAVDAHVDAVSQARPDTHGLDAVEVRHDPERRQYPTDPDDAPPASAIPREVSKQLGGLAPFDEDAKRKGNVPNVLQTDRGHLRFFALLWATGKQQWRPDESVFPELVTASQKWWGDSESRDDETTEMALPADVTDGSGADRIDIEGWTVAFERCESVG